LSGAEARSFFKVPIHEEKTVRLIVEQSHLHGRVEMPPSKSHTIRAVVIATLAEGISEIVKPLRSFDTEACVGACKALGAEIGDMGDVWRVCGTDGNIKTPDNVIDVKNSGTTLYVILGSAALSAGYSVITGDEQTRRRPAQPLVNSLNDLGAEIFSTRQNGCAPFVLKGPLRGGRTAIHCPTSQYLTSLLINAPLAQAQTEIEVLSLNEEPYIEMTLGWLKEQGIRFEREGMRLFRIEGGQGYKSFKRRVPGDFSSATFFLVAAAITGSELTLDGLEMSDTQGDKAVVTMLREMGAEVEEVRGGIRIRGRQLRGGEFDLNATPDALPAMAVAGCFASGTTRLRNVAQARLKETDRIRVMRQELENMGGRVEELEDGLMIEESPLRGADVYGHGDHRVVMALAVAGLRATGQTRIDTAESVGVTFPNFIDLMRECGARISTEE
jgi:3-phosphoshikimate 1-carboxyvinyltransferase